MSRVLAVVLLLALAPTAALAAGGDCPLPPGAAPALGAADGEARLRFLQRGMRRAARQARIWAWSSAGVLLAVGNLQVLGALHVPDRGDRIDLWMGAASVGFSLAQMAAVPPLVTIDQWRLDSHVAHAAPGADRCALLAEAERYLQRDARSEEQATGFAMQAVTVLFNMGTGFVLGLGFHRWDSAASSIFLGVGLGELQILTQPTDSVKLLARYREGNLTLQKGEKPALSWRLVPIAARDHWGLSLAVAY